MMKKNHFAMRAAPARLGALLLVALAVLLGQPARPAYALDLTVGSGPGTCSEAAFNQVWVQVRSVGGTISFNCGANATIPITAAKIHYDNTNVTVEGGGQITLDANSTGRIFFQTGGTLNLRNMTLREGYATGVNDDASGGAVRSDSGGSTTLTLTNMTFIGNRTQSTGVQGGFGGTAFSEFDFGGGAVFARNTQLVVVNSTFSQNTSNRGAGGAVHIRSSNTNISNSVFDGNNANGGGFGGAIHADGVSPGGGGGGQLRITASSFTNNTTLNQGGAIYFYLHGGANESAVFDRLIVAQNTVVANSGNVGFLGPNRTYGGGIAGDGGSSIIISNSAIYGNRVTIASGGGAGGGLSLVQFGNAALTNVTLSSNRAEGNTSAALGGGVFISGNSFSLRHVTIANNYAFWAGGGILGENGTLTNTIVANNVADNPYNIQDQCAYQMNSGGGVLQFPDIVGQPGSANPRCASSVTTSDPRLAGLANNGGGTVTHALQPGSAAIDAGDCISSIPADQRGISRPQGARCDLGAYETNGPQPNTRLQVDSPANNTGVANSFTVEGWAFDDAAGAGNGTGVNLVSVHNGTSCASPILAQGAPNVARADVQQAFGLDNSYRNSGYRLSVNVPAGTSGSWVYTVCVRNSINNQYTAAITRSVVVSSPITVVDLPVNNQVVTRTFTVSGWAFDRGAPTGNGISLVRLFVNSAVCGGSQFVDASLGQARPDVRAAYGLPDRFNNTGYSAVITMQGGLRPFTVCARSTVTGNYVPQVTLSVYPVDPVLNIDGPTENEAVSTPFTIEGWAFDRAYSTGPGVDLVRVYVGNQCSGSLLGDATLNRSRPDVQQAFGLNSSFANTGYVLNNVFLPTGVQQITVCVRSTGVPNFTRQQTRTIRVSNVQMVVDMPSNNQNVSTTFPVAGWAFDAGAGSNGPGVNLIRAFRGTQCSGTVLADLAYGQPRPDVQQAFGLGGSYANTGFRSNVSVSPGSLTFTVCARSTLTGTFTRSVTRTVNVIAGLELETGTPTATPTSTPTLLATSTLLPTATASATLLPTGVPTNTPSATPTDLPTLVPTTLPTSTPTETPTLILTAIPTDVPTATPFPTDIPTQPPTATPIPTDVPTATPLPTDVPPVEPPPAEPPPGGGG